jgi:hypothetical protein
LFTKQRYIHEHTKLMKKDGPSWDPPFGNQILVLSAHGRCH